MTRINCVPTKMLSNKHLVAEWHEIPRIITLVEKQVANGGIKPIPDSYRMGKGHMQFFADKLSFIVGRSWQIKEEMLERDFDVDHKKYVEMSSRAIQLPSELYNHWMPMPKDMRVNLARLLERDYNHYKKYEGYYG